MDSQVGSHDLDTRRLAGRYGVLAERFLSRCPPLAALTSAAYLRPSTHRLPNRLVRKVIKLGIHERWREAVQLGNVFRVRGPLMKPDANRWYCGPGGSITLTGTVWSQSWDEVIPATVDPTGVGFGGWVS